MTRPAILFLTPQDEMTQSAAERMTMSHDQPGIIRHDVVTFDKTHRWGINRLRRERGHSRYGRILAIDGITPDAWWAEWDRRYPSPIFPGVWPV